jgi:predicted TIM-barrel fold metal-dependent hydrolase
MIDALCHILPPKYEETRWARAGSIDFSVYSPAHLAYRRTGHKSPNYEGLTSLDARFRMMDEFDGYRQVLSLAGPPPEVVAPNASRELSAIANDELAELLAKYPDRFAGAVAAVPMNDTSGACREIERAVGELGLHGVQLYTNVNGKPLDAEEFRPVFQTVAERHVPIILHPARSQKHADYATEQMSKYLIWQIFGWPYESTAAMMRLVFSGMLEEYPDLQILVHHTAAMIPFFHGRMQSLFVMFESQLTIETDGRLSRPPLDYFRGFYADTAVYTVGSIDCAREFLGADHVLFGTDAPFDATGGRSSVRESVAAIRNSSCTETEKESILTGNVRRFFRLAPSS